MTEPSKDPQYLVVLAFESTLKAQEALLAVTRLVTEGTVELHDAVFLAKNAEGAVHVVETVDTSTGDAAVQSGVWGALIGVIFAGPVGALVGGAVSAGVGALAAALTDIGIPNKTVKELEEAIGPSTTALALLVSHVHEDAFLTEMHRFAGARLVQSTLSPMTVQALRNALRAEPSSG